MTGAGGSIGFALTRRIAGCSPQLLVLLDHSEQNLYQVESDLTLNSEAVPFASVLGDICNEALLSDIFERYRPNIVYHAAAFKHVPLMERKSDCSYSKQCARNECSGQGRTETQDPSDDDGFDR